MIIGHCLKTLSVKFQPMQENFSVASIVSFAMDLKAKPLHQGICRNWGYLKTQYKYFKVVMLAGCGSLMG